MDTLHTRYNKNSSKGTFQSCVPGIQNGKHLIGLSMDWAQDSSVYVWYTNNFRASPNAQDTPKYSLFVISVTIAKEKTKVQ